MCKNIELSYCFAVGFSVLIVSYMLSIVLAVLNRDADKNIAIDQFNSISTFMGAKTLNCPIVLLLFFSGFNRKLYVVICFGCFKR